MYVETRDLLIIKNQPTPSPTQVTFAMLKKSGHLSFTARTAEPPPPLISVAAIGGGSATSTAVQPKDAKKKKKSMRQLASSAETGAAAVIKALVSSAPKRPLASSDPDKGGVQKRKKKKTVSAESFSTAFSEPSEEVTSTAAEQKAQPASDRGAAMPVGGGVAFATPVVPGSYPCEPAAVGSDASTVLLLLSLPDGIEERTLQHHFASCAPLQVQMLTDWASGETLGAACLALGSSQAVEAALQPQLVCRWLSPSQRLVPSVVTHLTCSTPPHCSHPPTPLRIGFAVHRRRLAACASASAPQQPTLSQC